ncbi:SDR family NAD(P)-dependent oxidoreductase [Acinetobacter sp. 1207_04]|uniref:SDR family NAD(P)-dependent oxidoreductase n=1 Tax=Acinetobacter sp. 1207_04 TaxID=2604449 RepID=UPI004058D299
MKTILITGANTGIGLATAETFVKDGHHVILACRNLDKASQAKKQLDAIGTGKVDTVTLDLNDLAQIAQTADTLISQFEKIDVLVNNAGMMTPQLESTADGFEKQIGVNYIGPFLLTMKLLPLIKKAEQGRIIHLASMMHLLGQIDVDHFKADQVKKYNGVRSYANSKLANLLFSNTLAQQLQGSSVTSNALHPGGVDSEIYRELPKYQYNALKLFLIPTSKPAELIKKMAFSTEWSQRNGDYASLQTPALKSRKAKDRELGQYLFDQTLQLVHQYL